MTQASDLIIGGASGVATRFAVGTNGQVLTVAAGALAWGVRAGESHVGGR